MLGDGIPPCRRPRGRILVILGACRLGQPEPLAPPADAILIGEAEEVLADPIAPGGGVAQDRRALLEALAEVPGSMSPRYEGGAIPRRVLSDLDAYPLATRIYAPRPSFDMALIEIARARARVPLCLAGYWYRPAVIAAWR